MVNGLLAGGVFLLAQMVITRMLGSPFITPLRILFSLLGNAVIIDPHYSPPGWALVALLIQASFSIVWGVIFVFLLAWGRQLDASLSACVGYGAVYGIALWIVNFFILSPALFPQLTLINQFWNGFVAHMVFFGAFLGYSFGVSRERPVLKRHGQPVGAKM